MKRAMFAWGLAGCLVLASQVRADEPGFVEIDQIGYSTSTYRGQSPEDVPAPAAEAEGEDAPAAPAAPAAQPLPHGGHGGYAGGCSTGQCYGGGYGGYYDGGYGSWTSQPGCATCCCSDEGIKVTGNPIIDAPFELTTALAKAIFCHGKCCNSCKECCGPKRCLPASCRYRVVYPTNPYYFDRRDGQVFSAEGYGAPMAVPVAPCVRQTYNYSWGIPSSRITPLSRMPGGPAPY